MSLDEKAYHYAIKAWRRLKKKTYFENYFPDGFSTKPYHRSLLIFANSISADPVQLGFTENWFGWNQNSLFVPETLRVTKSPEAFHVLLVLQICHASIARERFGALTMTTDLERTNFGLSHRQELKSKASQTYTGYESLLMKLEQHLQLENKFSFRETTLLDSSFSPLVVVPIEASMILQGQTTNQPPNAETFASGKEHFLKTKSKVELITLPQKKDHTNPVTHNFEKLLTVDDYKGGQKRIDGEDEILEHQEALEELKLSQVVRSAESTQGLVKSDLMVNFNISDSVAAEPTRHCFLYDEWDAQSNRYKKNWCAVSEIEIKSEAHSVQEASSVPPTPSSKIHRLQREFNFISQQRSLQKRVRCGDDIDLDASVDYAVSLMSKKQPDDRIEQSHPQRQKDLAILILQDLSLSTDSWVHNHRVLDVCKESISVLGEVVEPFHPQVSIYGFCSHTHRDCRLVKIKSWTESWAKARRCFQSVKPMGYTRLGPALRHATYLLQQTKAKKKMILLLSDGKPNDYDQYEGRYGILDVRRAVLEAQTQGILTQCLAIDKSAKAHLPVMFQPGNYSVLSKPEQLTESLSRVFKKVLFS